MSNSSSQQLRRGEAGEKREGGGAATPRGLQELPLQSSPYVRYDDVEDYKRQGYGTEGHLQPVDRQPAGGGVGTDAPTLSGSGLSQGEVRAAEAHHGKGGSGP